MDKDKQSNSSKDFAREFIDRFSFKTKLGEILNEKDEGPILILSANLAIFTVSFTILFTTNALTASALLILISAVLSLLSGLLNIWYLIRIKTRMNFLKKEQDRVFNKAEANIVRTYDFFKKIMKVGLLKNINTKDEKSITETLDKVRSDESFNFLAEEGIFIPMTILELSLKETRLNVTRCLNSPLDESYAGLKLFIDRLSDKTKNLGLILSSAFILCSLLIKFIFG